MYFKWQFGKELGVRECVCVCGGGFKEETFPPPSCVYGLWVSIAMLLSLLMNNITVILLCQQHHINLGQLLWRVGIWLFGLGGNLVSKTSIEHCSRFAHASSSAENEWSEGGQLDFSDPLLIQASFDWFMVGITGRDALLYRANP